MPELPEVETVARQLRLLIVGRTARGMVTFDPKLRAADRADVGGRTIQTVTRRAKRVLVEFGPGAADPVPLWLAVHLRMTGRLLWRPGIGPAPRPHLRAAILFADGALELVDPRRFGTMAWIRSPAEGEPGGIDPTSDEFTAPRLARMLAGSRQQLKAWLLRQDRIAGLGNIYASEILHRARISPLRAAGSLDRDEVRRLHAATRRVLVAAIRHCGTTFSDFQDPHGATGGFLRFLRVYDREGKACPRCGTPIRRTVQQQRSTYYCPRCTRGADRKRTPKKGAGRTPVRPENPIGKAARQSLEQGRCHRVRQGQPL